MARRSSEPIAVWTEGQRQLRIVLLTRNAAQVARLCHVTRECISGLARGHQREPSLRLGLELEERCRIPAKDWIVAPRA